MNTLWTVCRYFIWSGIFAGTFGTVLAFLFDLLTKGQPDTLTICVLGASAMSIIVGLILSVIVVQIETRKEHGR